MKKQTVWLLPALLVAADQLIKLIINATSLGQTVALLPPVLYFSPVFNRDYSWFESMLQLGTGKWLQVAITVLLLVFILLFYVYSSKRIPGNKTLFSLFAFLFSGALCSLIDKLFWDGSLDYVLINHLFTFDLKDVYVSLFVGLTLLFMVQKKPLFAQMQEKKIFEEFFRSFSGKKKSAPKQ